MSFDGVTLHIPTANSGDTEKMLKYAKYNGDLPTKEKKNTRIIGSPEVKDN